MSLLNHLKGMIFGGDDKGSSGVGNLFPLITGLLGSSGGLGGLMEKFNAAGLGEQVKSWVGLGPNQAVSGEQVEKAVGSDQISQIATALGLDKQSALAKIAEFLPKIVDKMTPTGQVPSEGHVSELLEALKKNMSA